MQKKTWKCQTFRNYKKTVDPLNSIQFVFFILGELLFTSKMELLIYWKRSFISFLVFVSCIVGQGQSELTHPCSFNPQCLCSSGCKFLLFKFNFTIITKTFLQAAIIDHKLTLIMIDRGYGSFWQASKGSVIRKLADL
jgi:hypothetical protein